MINTSYKTFSIPSLQQAAKTISPKVSFRGEDSFESTEAKVKNVLDKGVYEFETREGEKFNGSIEDFIKENIVSMKKGVTCTGLLHGTMRETAQEIMQKGFDPNKIARTECGPGVSFTHEESVAREIGGGYVLQCDFEGNAATTKFGYFNKIKGNKGIYADICGVLGLNSVNKNFEEAMKNYEIVGKYIYKYVRDVLINNLEIHAANDLGNYPTIPGCFVVFDTSRISNINQYGI